MNARITHWMLVSCLAGLTACGGDGGDGGEDPNDVTGPTVSGAPVILSQPASVSVDEGDSASFTVQAGGDAPLAYQWQRGDSDVAGATGASYSTPALGAADDGALYRVVVSNPAGSVTSAAAAVSVVAAAGAGVLKLSGPGVDAVGAGTRYAPTSGSATPSGPVCSAGSCSSSLQLVWHQGPGDQLFVSLLSNNLAAPGAAPGTEVNGISITLSSGVIGSMGLNYVCVSSGCSLEALGITLDREARTLSFKDSSVPAYSGGPEVVLNGTLRY
ncbi:hypothetical protein CLD22_19670 [Rubrivivax gelatinosus]|nr:hypothetical protein [Rubrivivax gelatinosus]